MKKFKYEPSVTFRVQFDKFVFNEEQNVWDYKQTYYETLDFFDAFFQKEQLGKNIKSLIKRNIIKFEDDIDKDKLDWNDFDELL